jgi:uncharacterized protein (TIGR02145 family)
MKRSISLGAILLALGSCQSDNAPTQPSDSAEMVGVSARLVATSALPAAARFRARLTIGSQPGTWIDTTNDKGTVIRLGKVMRGSVVTLDVQGYSVAGTDTTWKWFANKTESITGNLAWKVMETQVVGLALVPPGAGQPLKLPEGSWFTTDTTQSWTNLPTKSTVDSTGMLPPLSGSVLRIRLRVGIPGTKDTLVGDTLRIAIPQRPSILPALRKLEATDVVRIAAGATGDAIEYCKGESCADWTEYATPLAAGTFTLRARARRSGLVSLVEEARFTLESSSDSDTIVSKPNISPVSGALANTDKITITASKTQDTIWIKVGEGDWTQYVDPIPAGAFEVLAVSRRGKYHSDTVSAAFTISTTKPSSPNFLNDCQTDCDPGTRIGLEPAGPGDSIQYALLSDSTVWHPYTVAKIMLEESNTVLARIVRGSDTSATQRRSVVIVQPVATTFMESRRTADTVWVVASSTSGTVWFRRDQAIESTLAVVTEPIAVRVGHSISAWASRGTRKSGIRTFTAEAVKPSRPSLTPTDSIIGLRDSIRISPASSGDTIQFRIGSAIVWMDYENPIAPGGGGLFTITVRALRNGLFSIDTVRTFFVDTAQLASPTISQDLSKPLDPGTEFVVSVAKDFELEYTTDTTKVWSTISTTLRFTADKDTTIFARTKSATKKSPIRNFVIRITQPGDVTFAVGTRTSDAITVGIVANPGDTILYSRNAQASTTSSVGPNDTVFVSVPMEESITARAKRGTKVGPSATFVATPTAPKPPRIVPEGGDIRDTTRISIIAGDLGDSLYYRFGSMTNWTPFTGAFQLPIGAAVVAYARSTRYGLSSHDTATFIVHGRPDTVRFGGCSIECDPGAPLVLTASSQSTIRWSNDTVLGWELYDANFPPAVTRGDEFFAYADSAGHRSATSSLRISVLQPRSPTITAVKVTRDSAGQLAQIDVQAGQVGDSLFVTIDGVEVFKGRVATAPLKNPFELRIIDSELRAFTKRGTATSPETSMPVYTLEEFSMPLPDFPSGPYTIGKTFRFSLPGNAQSGDAIHLSTDLGATWRRIDSIKLNETAMVWARSVRNGFGNSYDSSAILKLSYTMDSVILTHIVIQSGAARHSFELRRFGPNISDTLPFGSDPVKISVSARTMADLRSVTYSCPGCTRIDSNTFQMSDFGSRVFTVTATSKSGLVLTHQVNILKTSPWNSAITYGSVSDARSPQQGSYRTVRIGTATWMAQNLNLERNIQKDVGRCIQSDTNLCKEFGRLYTWAEAMNLDDSCNTSNCAYSIRTPHTGICPTGFHVPTIQEWRNLLFTVDPTADTTYWTSRKAGSALRSPSSAWWSNQWSTTATDDVGFRAIPTLHSVSPGSPTIYGTSTAWWSTDNGSSPVEEAASITFAYEIGQAVLRASSTKTASLPLRCVMD